MKNTDHSSVEYSLDLEGKVIEVSSSVEEVLGYTVEEIVGKTIFDLLPKKASLKAKAILPKPRQKHLMLMILIELSQCICIVLK